MSKSATIGVVVFVLIVLAGGGVLLAKHHSNNSTASTNSTSNMNMNNHSTSSQSNSSSSAPTATDMVTIKDMAFSPASITVKKGTTVTWTNNDAIAHTVTETDGQTGPNSGDLAPGKTYTFTYNTAGTFKYHCSIHPSMTGTVTVTE